MPKLPERPTKAKPRNLVVIKVEGAPRSGKNSIAALINRYLTKHGLAPDVCFMAEAGDTPQETVLNEIRNEYRERKDRAADTIERKRMLAHLASNTTVQIVVKQTKRT